MNERTMVRRVRNGLIVIEHLMEGLADAVLSDVARRLKIDIRAAPQNRQWVDCGRA